MLALLIWSFVGLCFILLGIRARKTRQPVGFWANVKTREIADPVHYNKAVGNLWITAGFVFILLGLPLLAGQNSPWPILSVLGCVFWMLSIMIYYELVIVPKYQKK